jgi:hypothetical protein
MVLVKGGELATMDALLHKGPLSVSGAACRACISIHQTHGHHLPHADALLAHHLVCLPSPPPPLPGSAVDASDPSFRFYAGGVYSNPDCATASTELDHAVILSGYGTTDDGLDYWLVKNIWSPFWVRVVRGLGRNAMNKSPGLNDASVPMHCPGLILETSATTALDLAFAG